MRLAILHFILIFTGAFCFAKTNPPPSRPFWKSKPKAYEKVVKDHQILVSVTSVTHEGKNRLKVSGGGRVNAPRDFTQSEILNFEKVLKDNAYVKSYQVDRKHQFIFVKVKAYGLGAGMKLTWKDKTHGKNGEIHFKVVSGVMTGFEGTILLEDMGPKAADIGIEGVYDYDQFPLPSLFLKFGLEVIFQRLAIELRSVIEENFRNESSRSTTTSASAFPQRLWI